MAGGGGGVSIAGEFQAGLLCSVSLAEGPPPSKGAQQRGRHGGRFLLACLPLVSLQRERSRGEIYTHTPHIPFRPLPSSSAAQAASARRPFQAHKSQGSLPHPRDLPEPPTAAPNSSADKTRKFVSVPLQARFRGSAPLVLRRRCHLLLGEELVSYIYHTCAVTM